MIMGERVYTYERYRDGPLLVIKWRYQVPLPVYMTENRWVTVVINPYKWSYSCNPTYSL